MGRVLAGWEDTAGRCRRAFPVEVPGGLFLQKQSSPSCDSPRTREAHEPPQPRKGEQAGHPRPFLQSSRAGTVAPAWTEQNRPRGGPERSRRWGGTALRRGLTR